MSSTASIQPESTELFTHINAEVTWLHAIWELFIQLYGSSDQNIEVMNSSAPQFFAILRTMLFDELVMILSRLTDSATTGRNANASLEQLISQIDQTDNSGLVRSLRRRLAKIRVNDAAFRVWRDKRVSHNDLVIALESDSHSLPGITRAQCAAAITEIVGFMNDYSQAILAGSQSYVPFMAAHGDANALLQCLKQGIGAKKE